MTAAIQYGGDNNYTLGTVSPNANSYGFSVILEPTSTTLTATSLDSPASTQIGRTVTLKATTTNTSGTTTPTGTFTFTLPVNTSASPSCGTLIAGGTTGTVAGSSVGGVWTGICTFTVTAPAQTNNYSVTYNPDSSTATSSNNTSLTVVKDATATTLMVTADADQTPSLPTAAAGNTQIGRVVTLTATAADTTNGLIAPGGSFTFTLPVNTSTNPTCGTLTNGGTTGTVAGGLVGGVWTATCTFTLTAPAGLDTYSATYNADANTASSTSPNATINVVKDATATTLMVTADADQTPSLPTAAAGPTQIGRVVTLTATAADTTNGLIAPGGSFTFTLPVNTSTNPTCGTLTNGGTTGTVAGGLVGGVWTATCTFTLTAPAGLNTYSATYNADANTASSTSPNATINVVKDVTATTLNVTTDADVTVPTAAAGNTQVGRLITLTATAADTTNGLAALSGSFTFTQTAPGGPTAICTNVAGALVGGVWTATCTFRLALPIGTDTYSATYNGDASTLVSTSPNATIAVVKATTTTSLLVTTDSDATVPTAAATNTQLGRTVTLTAVAATQANAGGVLVGADR